jgi:hypothetical protein
MSDQSGPKLTVWAVTPDYEQTSRAAELQECAHKERACQLARNILQRARLWGNELYESETFVYRASKILEQRIGSAAMCETLDCTTGCTLREAIYNQTIK